MVCYEFLTSNAHYRKMWHRFRWVAVTLFHLKLNRQHLGLAKMMAKEWYDVGKFDTSLHTSVLKPKLNTS